MTVRDYMNTCMPEIRKVAVTAAWRHKVDPTELLQDAIEVALRREKNYRDDRGKAGFLGWFYRICVNVFIDQYRRGRRQREHQRVDIEEVFNLGREGKIRMDDRARLAEVWWSLRKRFGARRTKVMYMLSRGWKMEEIARETGSDMGTVKGLIFRMREYVGRKYD